MLFDDGFPATSARGLMESLGFQIIDQKDRERS